jgi:hypothetical protein
MKCPKCGYNSFEFLDACKKCGAELGSFKKTHRISTVICRAAAVPMGAAVEAVPLVATQAPVQQEDLNASFDLGFPDTPPAVVKDEEFTGFTFSDEPAPPAQVSTSTGNEASVDDFTFGEPAEDASKSTNWDIDFDETGSGMEDYERILEPASLDSNGKQPGGNVTKEAEDSGSFGTSEFDFAPESSREDIFGMENKPEPSIPAEKKPQPNLEDFDKEFEMIFASEDSDDSGEKTTK